MSEEEKPPKETASFNSAAEYIRSLITIERSIADAFAKEDWKNVHIGLELFWMELSEWFDDKEKEQQDKIRQRCKDVWKKIYEVLKNKEPSIPSEYIEEFVTRTIMLKKILHKWGLRMPHTEDISGIPSLMRPARMGFRR